MIEKYQVKDFVNIPYLWGGTDPSKGLDCLGLHNYICWAMESRVMTGYKWVIDSYGCDSNLPPKFIRMISKEVFKEPTKKKGSHLDFLLMDWFGRDGVGTVFEQGNEKYVIYTGTGGSHFTTYSRAITRIRGIWDTRPYSKHIEHKLFDFNYHEL